MIPGAALIRGDYIPITAFATLTLLAATYWLSSVSRRSTLLAMAELESARRGIRQRDALLHEAHDDLDRAVAGARTGRLTGRSIDGFALGSILGRGAMGEVYRATSEDSVEVAIKVLHPHLIESPGQVARFLREAQIIATLDSPHIPKLFRSGTDDEGAPYLVMELLRGLDLAADISQLRSSGQVRGNDIDQRADVWAASVVLWELLTGARLFILHVLRALRALIQAAFSSGSFNRRTRRASCTASRSKRRARA